MSPSCQCPSPAHPCSLGSTCCCGSLGLQPTQRSDKSGHHTDTCLAGTPIYYIRQADTFVHVQVAATVSLLSLLLLSRETLCCATFWLFTKHDE